MKISHKVPDQLPEVKGRKGPTVASWNTWWGENTAV